MDLSGSWRAAPLDAELNRTGADPDLDDSTWAAVQVPGHWATAVEFTPNEGPLLYRRHFEADPPAPGKRAWLTFEGVLAHAEVWLDGNLLGDTSGYFVPHRFEITDALASGGEHVLAVEVDCLPQDARRPKSSLTGTLQTGPLAPPGNPGGIWRPVRIERTGPAAIQWSRLVCTKASAHRAEVKVRLGLDVAVAGDYRFDTSITGPDGAAASGGTQTHTLATGENRIEWTHTIDHPSLWWPAGLGDQPLYEVAVSVRPLRSDARPGDAGEPVSDRCHWRTGLRRVEARNLVWRVNGRQLFLKGVSLGPQSARLGDLDPQVIVDDLMAAREAGFDLVRVHGHVARPELYEAADRLGMLLWQDLPLTGVHATRTRRAARSLARAAVDLLGHHPSIVVWCAHDEPNGPPLPEPLAEGMSVSTASRLGRHLSPSWNRSVLGPLLRRELRSADPSRPIIARSGSLPMLSEPAGSDSHLWLGWHAGDHEDLPAVLRQWPRLAAFVGGFGTQSVDIGDWDADEPSWPTAERGAFERYVPRRAYPDGESWAAASQAYQADLLRFHIETIRRLKFRPAGGFCLMALVDPEPSGGFGILFHDRRRKPAFNTVLDACRPVIVVADHPSPMCTPGEQLSLAIHAVNDRHEPIRDVRVVATARCGDWIHTQQWDGELPPNTCDPIGELRFTVPAVNGSLIIDLQLQTGALAVTNRYQTVVIPSVEATTRHATAPQR